MGSRSGWRGVSATGQRCALLAFLILAGCAGGRTAAGPEPSIHGLWAVQEVAGVAVPSESHLTLSLYGDGRAVGRAGCNNYTTKYKRDGTSISFASPIVTKKACGPEVMDLEQRFLGALAAATRVERRPDGTLVLTTESSGQIVLRRQESAGLQDARARGIDFRAIGQEPGWLVELKEGEQIHATLDYGATSLALPAPAPKAAEDGTLTYDASTDTDHLLLSIRNKVCVDAMSGEPHAATVQLAVNDKTYRGCGDWLD